MWDTIKHTEMSNNGNTRRRGGWDRIRKVFFKKCLKTTKGLKSKIEETDQ